MALFAERVEATKSMEMVGMTSWLAVVAMIASNDRLYGSSGKDILIGGSGKTIFQAREGVISSEWCAKKLATSSKISLMERTQYS